MMAFWSIWGIRARNSLTNSTGLMAFRLIRGKNLDCFRARNSLASSTGLTAFRALIKKPPSTICRPRDYASSGTEESPKKLIEFIEKSDMIKAFEDNPEQGVVFLDVGRQFVGLVTVRLVDDVISIHPVGYLSRIPNRLDKRYLPSMMAIDSQLSCLNEFCVIFGYVLGYPSSNVNTLDEQHWNADSVNMVKRFIWDWEDAAIENVKDYLAKDFEDRWYGDRWYTKVRKYAYWNEFQTTQHAQALLHLAYRDLGMEPPEDEKKTEIEKAREDTVASYMCVRRFVLSTKFRQEFLNLIFAEERFLLSTGLVVGKYDLDFAKEVILTFGPWSEPQK